MTEYDAFWERSWREEDLTELYMYLDMYRGKKSREIDIFREHNVINVCDAACGFGAFSLAFASNGFLVQSFDISETAVEITRNGLKKYGLDTVNVKVASIWDTGYASETFDGVVAHAVLDHLVLSDARKALNELLRITAPNGLVMLSFDNAEEDDLSEDHEVLEDETMLYTSGARRGMLFHPYDWEKINEFLKDLTVIYKADNQREKIVILQK